MSAYGPRQHQEAKVWSQQIWGWSMDLLEATSDNDTERAGKLLAAIAEATAALQALTERAAR